MPLNTTGTLLEISSPSGIPLYAARGLSQTFDIIPEATHIELSINARPINFSYAQFRLYSTEITCTDLEAPLFDNLWPGDEVVVKCTFELFYPTSGGFPGRAVVSGSSRTEGDFTFYRPELTMSILSINFGFEEYNATYNWRMNLREIPPTEES